LKAKLVFDMPNNCFECKLSIIFQGCFYCAVMLDNRLVEHKKPDWCPLIPVEEEENGRATTEKPRAQTNHCYL
jgi:hypothetical protein